jgi:hyperosmotically inducible protein
MKTFTHRIVLSTALASVIALGVSGCDREVENTNAQQPPQQPQTFPQPNPNPNGNATTDINTTSDGELSSRVETALNNDKALETSNISVSTIQGEVTLSGDVESQRQRDMALRVARETNGVRTVTDNLVVREGNAAPN